MKTKHLLSGVAVIAALALSAPAWAQPANPSGGNSMGMPGPSPGGPGLTPYSTGAPPSGRMPAGGRATSEPTNIPSTTSASDTSSAMPPKHHHARAHHVVSTHQMLHAHGPKSGTDTTAQLNQAELARLQAGAPPMGAMPPPAPMPSPSGGNSMGMPGPNAGGPGLTPYSAGAPPR
jgi:ABC-type nickel/cobalt efflux system permease component RcnA